VKRDWELVRKILLRIEELPASRGESVSSDSFNGYAAEFVSYHMEMMHEAGLIKALTSRTINAPAFSRGLSLTWDGQEFLDNIRSETVWNKIKGVAKNKGIDLSLDTIKDLAKIAITSLLS
jgi:hypothetical protein